MAGANVVMPTIGAGVGGNSRPDGHFQFTFDMNAATPRPLKIIVRRIGYIPLTFNLPKKLSNSIEIEFKLCRDVSRLEDVIVTGQGSPEREDGSRLDDEDLPISQAVAVDGRFLVILNRGRLFSVSIRKNDLRTVSVVDAFGVARSSREALQQQVLVEQQTIIVAGSSDLLGGTEVSLYHINSDGLLRYLATYQFRMNRDYYRVAPEPVRLTGGKLVFHAQSPLSYDTTGIQEALPSMRRMIDDAHSQEFIPLINALHAYRPAQPLTEAEIPVIQSVTTCDILQNELSCKASAVVSTWSGSYSSGTADYMWTSAGPAASTRGGVSLYRMPNDGSPPTAVRVDGLAVGPMALSETGDFLNAIVRSGPTGSFASSVAASNDLFLLRFPLAEFRASAPVIDDHFYRSLGPTFGLPTKIVFTSQSVSFGIPRSRINGEGSATVVTSASLATTRSNTFKTSASLERIDKVGDKAIVALLESGGSTFQLISPERRSAVLAAAGNVSTTGDIDQRPNSDRSDLATYVLRTPNATTFDELYRGNASLLFLRSSETGLVNIGQITATTPSNVNDGCKSSCSDWYGDAHAIFVGDRIFAVLGYGLVEAEVVSRKLVERQRIDFFRLP